MGGFREEEEINMSKTTFSKTEIKCREHHHNPCSLCCYYYKHVYRTGLDQVHYAGSYGLCSEHAKKISMLKNSFVTTQR